MEASPTPYRYATADEPALRDRAWIGQQWDAARLLAKRARAGGAVLVLDEIQRLPGWSETVKRLWDEDTARRVPLGVVLLGSAPLPVQRGLTESLAGRFERIHLPHWSFAEMRAAFGWDLDRYLFHGGHPGAAPLAGDLDRWCRYVADSLIETTISRDVLLPTRVDKPALLRRLFDLACGPPGERRRGGRAGVVPLARAEPRSGLRRSQGPSRKAIEVKSGRTRDSLAGMDAFASAFKPHRQLLVGTGGIDVAEYLARPAADWVTG